MKNIVISVVMIVFLISCSTTQYPHETIEEIRRLSKTDDPATIVVMIPSQNGNLVQVRIAKPAGSGPFPAIIGCAGGDYTFAFFEELQETILNMGVVAVDFAPQGRGSSQGEDDHYGKNHQEDLKSIIEFTARLDFVNSREIGLISFSFGVVLATGTLATYPDLPVNFLIDVEGPSCPGKDVLGAIERNADWVYKIPFLLSQDINYKDHLDTLLLHGATIYDTEYWNQRDAGLFAKTLPCPYLRIQADRDHVQGYEKYHMMRIINSVSQDAGQWSRCNRNPPNIIYTEDNIDQYEFFPFFGGSYTLLEDIVSPFVYEMIFDRPWEK